MSPEETVSWTLLAVGLPSLVVGAYLTGTSGEVHLLLITGLGATGTWVALHGELTDDSGEDGVSDSEGGASGEDGASGAGGGGPGAGDSDPGAVDGTSRAGDRT